MILLFLAAPAPALSGILVLAPGTHDYPLASIVAVMEDETAKLDIAAVASGSSRDRFLPSDTTRSNYGFRRSALWFRLQIDFQAVAGHEWYLLQGGPGLDHLTVYLPDGQGGWAATVMGDVLPFSARPLALREFVLPFPYRLSASPAQPVTVFVRVAGEGALNVDLRVIDAQGLAERASAQTWGFGLFFGALLVMFLYNLTLYFSTREVAQFYYIVFLGGLTMVFFSLNGFGLQYLWPNLPRINGWFPVFVCVSLWGGLQFTRSFLDIRRDSPWADAGFRWMTTAVIAVFFLSLLLPRQWAYMLATMLPIFFGLVMFAAGVMRLRHGYRPARLFVAGWGVLLLGGILFPLANFGVLPANFFTEYAAHFGVVMLVVLLSLALGDRMKLMKVENDQIQQESHEKLAQMFGQLQQLDADKLRFLHYLSHELNTPLNWMAGLRAVDAEDMSPALRSMMDGVESGQQRMMELVAVVMRYFDLAGEDTTDIPLVPVAPMWLIDDLLREQAGAIAEKQLIVRNKVPADLVMLANEQRLRRTLGYLLDNAINCSRDGQTVELLGEVDGTGELGVLSIRDQGRGIDDAERISRLFEPFFMVGSRHRDGGFGLSLATAKLLITNMGGTIRALSEGRGRGALFLVTLPLVRPPAG